MARLIPIPGEAGGMLVETRETLSNGIEEVVNRYRMVSMDNPYLRMRDGSEVFYSMGRRVWEGNGFWVKTKEEAEYHAVQPIAAPEPVKRATKNRKG